MPRIEPVPTSDLPPVRRKRYETNDYYDIMSLTTLAYAERETPPSTERHTNYPTSLLDAKLLELIRIRSAQLGGCAPCSKARKVESADEEAVVCLIDTTLRGNLSSREQLALELLERLASDHHAIDDDFYRRLGQHFTSAEIIDLGNICGSTMGIHRFLHTLDMHGDAPPVIPYDRRQIGATWDELHPQDAAKVAAE